MDSSRLGCNAASLGDVLEESGAVIFDASRSIQ